MASKKQNILRFCPCCNLELDSSNFYTSINPHHNGFSIYCKNHCDKIYKEYYAKCKDIQKALWYTMFELGNPFVLDIYKKTMESMNNQIEKRKNEINPDNGKPKYNAIEMKKYIEDFKVVSLYIDFLRKTNSGANDWSTSFSGTDVDWKDISNNIRELEVKENEKQRFILDWGYQSEIEDYEFLEYTYYELTDKKTLTKPQEMLYRDLCLARLTKRKIDSGKIKDGDSKKTQDQILSLMSKLKIDNFAEEKDKTDIDKILERQIWEIENEEPSELVDKKEYEDFLGIGNTWYSHIVRAVKNIVAGTKNYPDVTKDEWD